MGRIKSALVKRTTRKLITEENLFSGEFGNNKKVLGGDTMPSKKVRNKIAGYLARLLRRQQTEKTQK